MRTMLSCLAVLLMAAMPAGCAGESDSEIRRTTGSISGTVRFEGDWPDSGEILIVAFTTPPWDDDFTPGAPPGAFFFEKPATTPAELEYVIENLQFRTYGALAIAWRDGGDDDPATREHALGVVGVDAFDLMTAGMSGDEETVLEVLRSAPSFELTAAEPDIVADHSPLIVLFDAETMKERYPSVGEMMGY